ncbi:MAG: hydantoinase/oxoprolinase family protein, partial [Bacillota bacterium]|nr:hydantoinase/oxoprolinase family protein [Bacillota bacterium]
MSIALGIDTGGTFTDGVIIDINTKEILTKAKALTTRQNLSIGITECIDGLTEINLSDIKLVSLSTTLATNAIVEGQGCEVGLILIGSDPLKKLPTRNVITVKGGHNIKGKEKQQLDIDEIKKAILELKPKVDAFAVSGYLSIRNPQHELAVKELIRELTGYQVVCAHELTTTLGFYERTVTATLNARLLPIIADLLSAVKKTMEEKSINAPLMIVKGDGSLISETVAKDRPIETLLSGPAASIVGAHYLTNMPNVIIADMGGTTTDIAVVSNGVPSVNPEGALVGGWLTRVNAASISTVGIGGDSYIQVNKEGKVSVGPQKVFPLAWVTHAYPHIIQELEEIARANYYPLFAQAPDVLVYVKEPIHLGLSSHEKELLEIIKHKPHTLYALGQMLGKDPNILPWERLVEIGLVHRSSLTPTDLLHYSKQLDLWNREAAEKAVIIQAQKAGQDVNSFCEAVHEQMSLKVAVTILEKVLSEEAGSVIFDDCSNCRTFLERMLGNNKSKIFNITPSASYPLVAIGAPVAAYYPSISAKIGAELIIPKHAEVANAIGAATGNVIEKLELLVQPSPEGGYLAYTPWGRKWFRDLDEATGH